MISSRNIDCTWITLKGEFAQSWQFIILTVLGGGSSGAPVSPPGSRHRPSGAAPDDPPLPQFSPPGQERTGADPPLCGPHTD